MDLDLLDKTKSRCLECSKCSIGNRVCKRNGKRHDPHTFGTYYRYMQYECMVISNYSDLSVFDGGTILRKIINGKLLAIYNKVNIDYSRFYITNLVKCVCRDSEWLSSVDNCAEFLRDEIRAIKPRLVIALGESVFSNMCSGHEFNPGKVTYSDRYKVKVFATHEPGLVAANNEITRHFRLICRAMDTIDCPF